MKRQTIVGLIAALTTGTVVLAAAAAEGDNRAPFWPRLKGSPVVTEWYMDVPWHQKLGTYAGNQIDQALVLPYDALGQAEKDVCSNLEPPLSEEQCMIEIGVNSIIGVKRTDTPYDSDDVKAKGGTYCKDAGDPRDTKLPCIEVRLEISGWWTRGTGNKDRPIRPGAASLWIRTTKCGRLSQRIGHHRRLHLRASDALVSVSLLRFTFYSGSRRCSGSCLLRRLSFPV